MTTTTSTYTTLPLSGADVIFRSFQTLTSFISHHRPWLEFISGDFNLPSSISHRLITNSKHFAVNYLIISAVIAAVSLIGAPATLLLLTFVVSLWLVLYFCREDPMIVCDYHVDDRIVMLGLVVVSVGVVWSVGYVSSLMIGVVVASFVCFVHCVFRDASGVFLDENEAVSEGIIEAKESLASRGYDLNLAV